MLLVIALSVAIGPCLRVNPIFLRARLRSKNTPISDTDKKVVVLGNLIAVQLQHLVNGSYNNHLVRTLYSFPPRDFWAEALECNGHGQ